MADTNVEKVVDLATINDLIDHPVVIIDADGQIISHNGAMAILLDQPFLSLNRLNFADFLVGPEATELPRLLSDALQQQKSKIPGSWAEIRLKPGAVPLTVKPIQMPDGKCVFLCQLVAMADASDPRLRFFLEHSEQGVWDFNIRANNLVVSHAWRKIRGLSPTDPLQVAGDHWLDDVHPEDREALAAIFEPPTDAKDKTVQVQYRMQHKSGHWVWLLCQGTILDFFDDGRPAHMVGTDTDISEIKAAEESISQLAAKMQLAIDASGMGIWEFDPITSSVHWDDRTLEIFGVTDGRNERSDRQWDDFLHPDDAEETLAHAADCLRRNVAFAGDYRIVRPDGAVRHVRSVTRNVPTLFGKYKMVGIVLDVTEDRAREDALERAQAQLEFDARHDALTGLANRRMLDETVDDYFHDLPDHETYAIMHIDLDRFKQINDTLGHAAGDAVLVHVAQKLSDIAGDRALISRMGGDEFVLLIQNAPDAEELAAMAQNIISAFQTPFEYDGHSCNFGASIGIATGTGPPTKPRQIFIDADLALYAAKNAGRGCHAFYSTTIESTAAARLAYSQELSDAITSGALTAFYQPQYDAKTNALIGAEALVRWTCPRRGVLGPGAFLPMAEDAGIINQIDERVLDCVLADQEAWHKAGISIKRVSINVGQKRLEDKTLVSSITAALADYHDISFELLETSFLDHPSDTVRTNLAQLRALGIGLELDDFGSGHASVVALQAIRPDRVKIEQQLVKPITQRPNQMAILKAMIQIARAENTAVTLEGIETTALLDAVRGLDCDVLQGFALGRPMSAEAFTALLLADQSKQARTAV